MGCKNLWCRDLPYSALLQLHAVTWDAKIPRQFPHMKMAARSNDRIQIQIKSKIALKISGYWVSLLSKENLQLLPQLKHTL